MSERVLLAMSGGVDSSVSAVLLKEQGYEVVGLFMRSGTKEPEESCKIDDENSLPIAERRPAHKQGCCSASDAMDAQRVADLQDIPFHAVNFEDSFGRIKDYFADEYLAGRTPNPCIACNNWLKFGKLWDFAKQVEATKIATGHYARVEIVEGCPCLTRGLDNSKDQSYVLFGIDPALLPHILFPVGDCTKREIRSLAGKSGLRVADKPDSQEICFIPDNDYAGFLKRYRGGQNTGGDIVDTAGDVVGQHDGYEGFTVGQRKGLGIAFGEPRYVVGIDAEEHRVVVGTKEELGRRELEADRLNWLVEGLPESFRCLAQIRYRHRATPASVTLLEEDRLKVEFEEAQYGVAPGQAVVFYRDDVVLGGGWIR